jgi:hypothetical protein
LNGLEENTGIAAGKVGAGATAVWHKKGVVDKSGVAHNMSHTRGGMIGGMQRVTAQITNEVFIAIGKQLIKLRAITGKLVALIKNVSKGFLNHSKLLADGYFSAQLLLYIGRARKMIDVYMGFYKPLNF